MYGIIRCSGCNKNRIINLSDGVTACPYCGNKTNTKTAQIIFKHEDQSAVRAAFDSLSGFIPEKKEKKEDKDPLSTLAYKVEHTSDIWEKMELISNELTRILGTFSVKDVDELVPGKGEQYVKSMLTSCMIYEVGYGKYRV